MISAVDRARVMREAADHLAQIGTPPFGERNEQDRGVMHASEQLRKLAASILAESDPTDQPPAGFFEPGRSYSNQSGYTAPEQVWHFRCTEIFLRPTSTGGVWVAGGQVHKPDVPGDDWGPAWITNRDRFTEITEETGT